MDDERYQVRSPNQEVHETIRSMAIGQAHVVLENRRRLSLSIERSSPELLDRMKEKGASVEREYQYDLDVNF